MLGGRSAGRGDARTNRGVPGMRTWHAACAARLPLAHERERDAPVSALRLLSDAEKDETMNAAELKELQRVIETQVVPELDAWLQLWREAEQQQPGSMHLDLQAEKVGNDRTKRTATVSKIVNAYIYEAFRAAVPQLFEAARARALQTLVEARVEAERTAIKELEAVRAQLQVETPVPVKANKAAGGRE